ncbi:MAG: ATP-binding domain-containing protein, partial [Candidatus Binatia bacterium]
MDVVSSSPETRAVIEEEEALLRRVRASLDKARQRAAHRRQSAEQATEALRTLRDQAAGASAEDLPPLLHEMSVRHRLAERREPRRLPEPAAPYIAHLRVNEGKGGEDYLLGHSTFFDPDDDVRIVDWRVA